MADGMPPEISFDEAVRQETAWEGFRARLGRWWVRQRRRLPYLVWWGDELDVTVTLTQDTLRDEENPLPQLFSGAFAEVERQLGEMEIFFDRGLGPEGRDWEWDWSLHGPISVRFRGRCSHPERRVSRRPRLVVDNRNRSAQ